MKLLSILFVVSAVLSPLSQGATISYDKSINLQDDLIVDGNSTLAYSYQNGGINFNVSSAAVGQFFSASLNTNGGGDFANATAVKFSFAFTQSQGLTDMGDTTSSFGMGSLLSSSSFNTQADYDYAHGAGQVRPAFSTGSTDTANGNGLAGSVFNAPTYTYLMDVEYVMASENSFWTNVYNTDKYGVVTTVDSYLTTLSQPIGDLLLNLSFDVSALKSELADCSATLKGIQYTTSPSVPEPSTASLGLIALGLTIYRRKK